MLYKRLVFMASIGKWVKGLIVIIRINKMNERTVKDTENDKKNVYSFTASVSTHS